MAYLLWEREQMPSSNKGTLAAAEPAPLLTPKEWRRDRWREEEVAARLSSVEPDHYSRESSSATVRSKPAVRT